MNEIERRQDPTDGQSLKKGPRRVGRRTALKVGAAVIGGVTLGSTYVKPEMRSVSLSETAYASGEPIGDDSMTDKAKIRNPQAGEKPEKKPKDGKP